MRSSTRIMINTGATYVRMAIVACTGILAIPIAMRAMGQSDYGIFAVIAGSMAFVLFITGALAVGMERHIAFSMGEGDTEKVTDHLTVALLAQITWACVLIFVACLSRHWILHHGLSIPPNRIAAAGNVFFIVVGLLVLGILQTPFFALLMAHEDIFIQSLGSIIGALIFLAGVGNLNRFHGDKLVLFTILYELNQGSMFLATIVFAIIRYRECRRISLRRFTLAGLEEMLSVSFWNAFNEFALLFRIQGPSVIINRVFGTVLNASYGVAVQVGGSINNLSTAVFRASYPQIVKSRAAGNFERSEELCCACCKYSTLLLWMLLAPLVFNTSYILRIWLRRVPPHADVFVVGVVLMILLDQLTSGYVAVMQALGKLAFYQTAVSTLTVAGCIAGYVWIHRGGSVLPIVWGGILSALFAGAGQILISREMAGTSIGLWVRTVLVPIAAAIGGSVFAAWRLRRVVQQGMLAAVVDFLIAAVCNAGAIFFLSSKKERDFLGGLFSRFERWSGGA